MMLRGVAAALGGPHALVSGGESVASVVTPDSHFKGAQVAHTEVTLCRCLCRLFYSQFVVFKVHGAICHAFPAKKALA